MKLAFILIALLYVSIFSFSIILGDKDVGRVVKHIYTKSTYNTPTKIETKINNQSEYIELAQTSTFI